MKINKLLFILPGVLILSGCSLFVDTESTVEVTRQNCTADDCLAVEGLEYPVDNLDNSIAEALNEAIQDEYLAWSTYDKVIKEFGTVRPFIMIIRAEEQHIASLKALFDKYGLAIPANEWPGEITAPGSLSEACAVGVEAEIANAALYRERLIPAAEGYSDIISVFENLMSASQNKHLPSFEKCK